MIIDIIDSCQYSQRLLIYFLLILWCLPSLRPLEEQIEVIVIYTEVGYNFQRIFNQLPKMLHLSI